MDDLIMRNQSGFDEYHKIWHSNGKNMIIYMHSDGGSIVCNEKIYPIKKGVLCFIGGKKYHYTMPDANNNYKRSKIFIPEDMFNLFISPFSRYESAAKAFNESSVVYAQIAKDEWDTVDKLFADISNYASNEAYAHTVFASCFLRLLVFISENTVDSITIPQGFVYKAIEYINTNINQDITVDSICEHVHISKYHFCRYFKKATGLTVMSYVLKTRIALAKTMLTTCRSSVGEISEACGFSNSSVFCRVFKENTSMTPIQYRKNT